MKPATPPAAPPDLAFHHVGVAVRDIDRARARYAALGYAAGEVTPVPTQKVKVCFVTRPGHPCLELIAADAPGAPVDGTLEKVGPGPYHACYVTADLPLTLKTLRREGFVPLGRPVPSAAFGGADICFVYNADVGLVELVQGPVGQADRTSEEPERHE